MTDETILEGAEPFFFKQSAQSRRYALGYI